MLAYHLHHYHLVSHLLKYKQLFFFSLKISQELQIQEEMLRKEREWIEAREKLAKFRKQRYKDTGHDSDSSSAF